MCVLNKNQIIKANEDLEHEILKKASHLGLPHIFTAETFSVPFVTCGISNRSTFLQVPCAGALLLRVGGGQAAAGHTFPASESHAVLHPTSLLSGRGLPRLKGKAVGPPFAGRGTAVGQLLGRGGLFRPRRTSQASVTLTASSWSCCFCFAPSLPVVLTQHPEGWRQGRSRPGSRPSRTPARGPRPWGVMLHVTAFGSSCRPDCLLPQCLPRNVSSYLATC